MAYLECKLNQDECNYMYVDGDHNLVLWNRWNVLGEFDGGISVWLYVNGDVFISRFVMYY